MKLLAFALAAATLAGVPALAQPEIRRPGPGEDVIQVTAVGRVDNLRQDRAFTLNTRRMDFVVMMRPGNTTLGDRIFGGERRIREGDRVRVTGELVEQGRIIADDIDILPGGGGIDGRPGNTIEGTLRNFSMDDRRFTLVTPGRGALRMVWADDTDWVRDRVRRTPREFRNGDTVRVMATQRPGGEYVARRIVFGGVPGWENNGVGEIVGLNARSQTAEVDFDGRVETVDLRNATIRRRDRRIDFEDLRTGLDVRVQGTRQGRGAINATTVDVVRSVQGDDIGELRTVEGEIAEIFQGRDAFRLDQSTGGDIRVVIRDDTRVVRGATQVGASSLRTGQRVRVRGRVSRNETTNRDYIEALRIEIL